MRRHSVSRRLCAFAATRASARAQVLAAMHEARLFRMYIPKALDGPEIDPIKSMIVVEEIAREIVKGGPDECRTQSHDHPGEGQMGLGQVPLSRVRNGTPA